MIRVAIAEDHPIFRNGLRDLFKGDTEVELVFEAKDGPEMIKKIENDGNQFADVILLDIDLPGCSGIEVLRRSAEIAPDVKVIILSVFNDPALMTETMQAGARGYLAKSNADVDNIIPTIKLVNRGSMAFTGVNVQQVGKFGLLTEREWEVAKILLFENLSRREIGERLHIPKKTVDGRIERVFQKLDVNSVQSLRKAYTSIRKTPVP